MRNWVTENPTQQLPASQKGRNGEIVTPQIRAHSRTQGQPGSFAGGQQNRPRLGDNNLPGTAASLAADTLFTKSGAAARRTLLGLGNWQVNTLEFRE